MKITNNSIRRQATLIKRKTRIERKNNTSKNDTNNNNPYTSIIIKIIIIILRLISRIIIPMTPIKSIPTKLIK